MKFKPAHAVKRSMMFTAQFEDGRTGYFVVMGHGGPEEDFLALPVARERQLIGELPEGVIRTMNLALSQALPQARRDGLHKANPVQLLTLLINDENGFILEVPPRPDRMSNDLTRALNRFLTSGIEIRKVKALPILNQATVEEHDVQEIAGQGAALLRRLTKNTPTPTIVACRYRA